MIDVGRRSTVAQLVERLTGDRRVASSRLTAGMSHWDVSLTKTHYPLLSTGSNQEDPSQQESKASTQKNKTNKLIDVGPSLNTD